MKTLILGLGVSLLSASMSRAHAQHGQLSWSHAEQAGRDFIVRIAERTTHLREDQIAAMSAEEVLRAEVQANADCDVKGMLRLMSKDSDAVNYTINGRRYVGLDELEKDLNEECDNVEKLELPLKEIKVWTQGEFAWFAMELDYIRYVKQGGKVEKMVLPLRETGVLQRRSGEWVLIQWHESFRNAAGTIEIEAPIGPGTKIPDLSGRWEIGEPEEGRTYVATLDITGNGPYTWQEGRIETTGFSGRHWRGTWSQKGNDREGGFEVALSEDGMSAKGSWWYTRVGSRRVDPAKNKHGGTYVFKRLN